MSNITKESLGAALRKLRKDRGITLKMLEAKGVCSSAHVSQVERGIVNVTFLIVIEWLKALGATFEELYVLAEGFATNEKSD